MDDEKFIDLMLEDYNTVERFYNDPETFIAQAELLEDMIHALKAETPEDLAALNIDANLVSAALSGSHTTGSWCFKF